MELYDFLPVSQDGNGRVIVLRDELTLLVNLEEGTYVVTGQNERPDSFISAEKFGWFFPIETPDEELYRQLDSIITDPENELRP